MYWDVVWVNGESVELMLVEEKSYRRWGVGGVLGLLWGGGVHLEQVDLLEGDEVDIHGDGGSHDEGHLLQ